MIKSMTGYGKGETSVGGKKITVEIRSLNSKQFDLSLRLPNIYRSIEYDIRNTLSKRLIRGKVDVGISYEAQSESSPVSVNKELFGIYYRQLVEVAKENGLGWAIPTQNSGADQNGNITAAILRLPEVVKGEVAAISAEELAGVNSCVASAIEAFDRFRDTEGGVLIADLLARIDKIEQLKTEVEPYEGVRTELVKNRIRENIESMSIAVDNNRLEQEMIYYIEKLDVTEEKVRLSNHCNYFRQVAAEESGVGRKLGFITQEIGREINTLGSKANNAEIQKIVVDMKDELEKIKEQLLNIL